MNPPQCACLSPCPWAGSEIAPPECRVPVEVLEDEPATMRRVGSAIAGVLSVVFLVFAVLLVIPGSPFKMIVVSGTSMEPWLHTGDLIVAMRRSNYEVGDAVVYSAQIEGQPAGNVIHRIVAINPDGTYVFQGDNKDFRDPWDVPKSWALGEVVLMVPKAYYVVSIWRHPIFLAAMAGLFLTMALWPADPLKRPPSGTAINLPPPQPNPPRWRRNKSKTRTMSA